MKEAVNEKDESLMKYKAEIYRLQENIRQQERLLKRIPPDILEELKKKGNRNRER